MAAVESVHGRGETAGGAALLNIGQVLDRLRVDYPSVTIPKIRFLEDKGLIKPERTPAGYRKFSEADVERLTYILRMQRDHELKLKTIAEHLDAMDRGLEPPALVSLTPTVPAGIFATTGVPGAEEFRRHDDVHLSRKELVKIAEISEDVLAELEGFGLVSASRTGHFGSDALVVARTARELADFGLEPRHLRAFRSAADREVGLIQQVTAPIRGSRDTAAGARADDAAAEVAALAMRLHATLVKQGLRSS
ncbi:transcriptional regulator FtsR [Nocardioides montaniterrae]